MLCSVRVAATKYILVRARLALLVVRCHIMRSCYFVSALFWADGVDANLKESGSNVMKYNRMAV